MFMQEKSSVLIKLVCDTYVTASSLFWEANMAAEKLINKNNN